MKKLLLILILLIILPSESAIANDSLREHIGLHGKSSKTKSVLLQNFHEEWNKVQNATGPLTVDGDIFGYWQGYSNTRINDATREGRNYAGIKARLRINWKPIENGVFFAQMQGGYSDTGSNPSSRGLVATPLNAQASRTTAGGQISISDVLYTQHFADNRIFISLGWTDPESFMDGNRFAGNSRIQFVNTMFNNEPIFDSIDESLPIAAAGFSPVDEFSFTILTQATRRSALSREQQKEAFEDMADDPLIGGQLTYSPEFGKLQGNYRIFGWTNTYKQSRLDGDGDSANWGIAFNMDQDITEDFGVFARLGKGNSAVNDIVWSWSAGTHWAGPFPNRNEDVWGVAAGGVQGNKHTVNADMEYHYETYYQVKLTDNFSIVPDITYVTNSNANNSNDDILFGMLKFFFTFSTP